MLGMKLQHWQIDLVNTDTGNVIFTRTVACSTAEKARDKGRFMWGLEHKVLIGTRIDVKPLGMRDLSLS